MKIVIRHDTVLRFDLPVRDSIQYLRLTPRSDAGQRILEWRIDTPGRQWRQTDAYGNIIVVTSCDKRHDEVRISAQGVAETFLVPESPMPNQSTLPPEAFLVPTALTQPDEEIRAIAAQTLGAGGGPEQVVRRMIQALGARIAVAGGERSSLASAGERSSLASAGERSSLASAGERSSLASASAVLARGRGTPQEHTHVLLACAREAGLPARYVSGYLSAGAGEIEAHAWADIWVDGRGWVSIDPARGAFPGQQHCRLAVGRDELDAAPVRDSRQGVIRQVLSTAPASAPRSGVHEQ